MSLRYIIGNEEDASRRILERLNKSGLVRLADYQHQNGDVAVMLSTNGVFHGDSYKLSQKVMQNRKNLMKVLYDGHADFGEETDEEAIRKILQENGLPETLLEAGRDFDTHMRRLIQEDQMKYFAILGLNNERQVRDLNSKFPKEFLEVRL